MKRRDFVTLAAATLGQAGAGDLWAQAGGGTAMDMGASDPGPHAAPADFTLRIAPVAVEIAPSHFVSTVGYNGTSPGPGAAHARGQARSRSMSSMTPTRPNWSIGMACSCPHRSMGPKRKARRSSRRGPGAVTASRRARPAHAGTTPTPWRWGTCIAVPIPANTALSSSIQAAIRAPMTRRCFSRCATGNISIPISSWTWTTRTRRDRNPRSRQSWTPARTGLKS